MNDALLAERLSFVNGQSGGDRVTESGITPQDNGPLEAPDVDCFTLPDGECIASPCRLHDPPEPLDA